MCHWTETRFVETLEKLDALKADSADGSEIDRLSEIVKTAVLHVASELKMLDVRVQHLEDHLRRPTVPTLK